MEEYVQMIAGGFGANNGGSISRLEGVRFWGSENGAALVLLALDTLYIVE